MSDLIDAEKEIEDWMARLRFGALTEEEEWLEGKWFSEDDESIVPSKETGSTSDPFTETNNATSDQIEELDVMFEQPKCRNQWAEINDPHSLDGLDALRTIMSNAKPLPGFLMEKMESKARLILTGRLQSMPIEGAIAKLKQIDSRLYEDVTHFYEKQGFADSERVTVKEIIRILMASHAGQDFYIPCSFLTEEEYKCARIVRLSGTSFHGL